MLYNLVCVKHIQLFSFGFSASHRAFSPLIIPGASVKAHTIVSTPAIRVNTFQQNATTFAIKDAGNIFR